MPLRSGPIGTTRAPRLGVNASNDGSKRETPKEDLELDPEAHDGTPIENVSDLDVETATLFRQALEQTRMAVTIADPHRPDSPIVYANHAFTELTGFPLEEIVGQNCRFL